MHDDAGAARSAPGAVFATIVARGRRGLRVRLPRLAVAALLTVLAWPVGAPGVAPGIDGSWGAALHHAARDGLVFGRDVVFTYGPLGYLVDARLHTSTTWALAVAAHLVAGMLLAYSLLRLLQRGMGLLPSALVAAPVVLLLNRLLLVGSPLLPQVLVLVVMLWSFEVVLEPQERVSTGRMLLLAVATAGLTAVKLDAGMACLILGSSAITVAGARDGGPRQAAVALARFIGAATAALVIIWVGVGQPVGALFDWLRRSVDIVRGYGAAMNIEGGQQWEYTVALLLVATVAALILRSSSLTRAGRWTTLALFAIVAFVAFKQGFVRHDAHVVQFFAVFAVLPVAFLRKWGTATTLVLMIVPFAALCAVGNVGAWPLLDPGPRLDAMADVAHLARSGAARDEHLAATRSQLRAQYGISPAVIDRIGTQRAAVVPWELLVASAYPEIDWDQLPIFQTYAAYTSSLDQLNADALTGSERPRFLLRRAGTSVDARVPRFESPGAGLAMLCHYRTALTEGQWQLLEATRDRCGAPTAITRRQVRFGETVRVPSASRRSIVVARFHDIAAGAFDELRTMVYRAREIHIQVDAGPRQRFIQGHQDAFHVLTAPACARAQLDGTTTRAFERFAITADSSLGGDDYAVEFFRIPFTC